MHNIMNIEEKKLPNQSEVTEFYNQLIFPSKVSRESYEKLVSTNLKGKRVGDFGCGQSLFIEIFRRLEYDAVFLDVSQKAIDLIDYGEKICASLTEIPLKDSTMDNIFCIGVVHHIPQMEIAINEIIRVLRPGGFLILGVYANNTTTAFIKRRYDRSQTKLGKNIIETVTRFLMWFKNKSRGISKEELQKRIDDLLLTPVVRYMPAEEYSKIIENFGCKVKKIERFNQMNILTVFKPDKF